MRQLQSAVVDDVFALMDELERPDRSTDIAGSVAGIAARFGFNAFILTGLPADIQQLSESVLLDAWPAEWLARYMGAEHFRYDPCARYCRIVGEPFTWAEIPPPMIADPRSRQVFEEAGEHGFRDGLCIPLHTANGFRGISLAGDRIELPPGSRRMLTMLSILACEAAERPAQSAPSGASPVKLTLREQEVLRWIAVGKTVAEVADILGLSAHTVTEHLRKARVKLGAGNTVHAVVQALRTRQIRL